LIKRNNFLSKNDSRSLMAFSSFVAGGGDDDDYLRRSKNNSNNDDDVHS
jgi:hypothetical protein